jgi:putative transposase
MTRKKDEKLKEVARSLVKEYKTKEALFGEQGVLKELFANALEACLEGEMTNHLGYEKYSRDGEVDNSRNGYSSKEIISDHGHIEIEVPRDRESNFEPQIIGKRQNRVNGFDDKIISLYASGLSTKDIVAQLKGLYGVEVSSSLISSVTSQVSEEVKSWQSRPLDRVYPIMYLDCIVVKVREDQESKNKSVYLALGVNANGHKELLGLWISQNEGAKFWLSVLTDLKNRGVEEMLIVCVDGLNGFGEAIRTVYPRAKVQQCIVHMVRSSLRYVSWKDRKNLCNDLKKIYTARTLQEAEIALEAFASRWDSRYPSISQSWINAWENITTFFAYPEDIRKVIYTTNSIESLNMTFRKIIKNKRSFPSDDSVFKLFFLGLNNITKRWTMPIKDWNFAMNRFIIEFGANVAY